MGSSQTKTTSSSRSTNTERVVEGLKNKIRVVQGEMNEVMRIREAERQAYESELMVFAFKQAEWKNERRRFKEEIDKVREVLEEKKQLECDLTTMMMTMGGSLQDQQQRKRDETVERWKKLYFAIKLELDDLIQRTHQEERLCCKREEDEELLRELKKELQAKEERVRLLEAKLGSMEERETKREREMDILRQSLRIMSHRKRATKLSQRPIKEF